MDDAARFGALCKVARHMSSVDSASQSPNARSAEEPIAWLIQIGQNDQDA